MAAVVIARRLRRSLQRQRVFRDRRNPLDSFSDGELYDAFRFYRADLLQLFDDLAVELEYVAPRQGSLPVTMQVMLALRFYATGTFQSAVAELFGVTQATASRTIDRVTLALVRQMPTWVRLPTQLEADAQKVKFFSKAGFPNVIGCIDGTHVRILAPTHNEHEYINRKNFHSINVQLICDADMRIINCVAKWPGSVHDARVLRESPVFAAFEGNPKPLNGFILGDSGYMLRDWLLTPLLNTRTVKDEAYNTALCGTRCTVERCIGILKRRWHCLHTELRVAPRKACQIICACVTLHNRATTPADLSDDDFSDSDDDDDYVAAAPPGNLTITERARASAAKAVRDRLIERVF